MTPAEPLSLVRELDHRDPAIAGAALDALVRLGPAAVPALCSTAAAGSGDSCWRAAFALGRIGDANAVPVLCSILTEPAIPPIVACLTQPFARRPRRSRRQMTRRRREAAAALGRIGAPEAVTALGRALSDSHPIVATSAQRALVALGPAALPRLCELLYTGSQPVRELAAGALGSIADPRAIEPLSHALAVDDRPVCLAAARALGAIATHHPTPELRQAIPALRRLLSPWSLGNLYFEARFRSALHTSLDVIETATRELKALPVPSHSPSHSPATLPVVSAAAYGTVLPESPSNDGDDDLN